MSRVRSVAFPTAFALLLGSAVLGAQADVFTQLGANEVEGRNQIFSAFSSGRVDPIGTAEVFKTAADAARVAMVQGVVSFARAYTGSADFARRYTEFRNARKPSPPGPAQTNDSMVAQQRKALEEGIANAQKMAESMPQMKADVDKMVAEFVRAGWARWCACSRQRPSCPWSRSVAPAHPSRRRSQGPRPTP